MIGKRAANTTKVEKMALKLDTGSPTRLSRTSMSNQWPPLPLPDLSVGARHTSMDILGRYSFWEVKKNSPAHQIWRTASEQIINLLEDHFDLLDAQDADMVMEIFMIARKEAAPSPTILFRCQSKDARQKAMELVNAKSIMGPYPGVQMAACSMLPKSLVAEDFLGLPTLPPGVYSPDALRHCGVSINISGEQNGNVRKATLGGVVCIDGLFYGLTTAHACFGAPGVASDLETELDFALYGLNGIDDIADEDHGGAEITSKDSPQSGVFLLPSSEQNGRPYAKAGLSCSEMSPRLGSVFISAPERGLNWALVAIENPDLTAEKISLNNRRFMVNSIYRRNHSLHTSAIYPRRLASEPADVEVLICTGNKDDPLEGRLSAIPSFQKIPGKNAFQELWVVKCIGGSFLADGDSGSWVVGCESGELYGIITLGYPGTETAYVTPAVEIFEDIDNYFGQQVDFSTPELWVSRDKAAAKSASQKPGLALMTSAWPQEIRPKLPPRPEEPPAPKLPPRNPIREERAQPKSPQSTNSIQTTPVEKMRAPVGFTERTETLEPRTPIQTTPRQIDLSFEHINEQLLTTSPLWISKPSASPASESPPGSTSSPQAASHASHRASTTSHTPRDSSMDSNPPCGTLYIRMRPSAPPEADLRAIFSTMPGYKGLRMKLNSPDCFVQFNSTAAACYALHRLGDYRFHEAGFARNVPRSGRTILTIEEEECALPEVYIPEPELTLPSPLLLEERSDTTTRRGRFAQLLTPRPSVSHARRQSIGSWPAASLQVGTEVMPSVSVVDEKREKAEKKARKARERKLEREREREMMVTTDHYVRWGP
ncbi:Cell wall integrity protein scw1 [Lachnellula suecica]|uniref:Cell wall integrity protein scw1 n=1 Tax=Lachnellula suecica TaxID=602035 RepID=A0A8T9CFY6_9HELO|nr:Cell wall integrity protein scw1 [Lachnellula suecica]